MTAITAVFARRPKKIFRSILERAALLLEALAMTYRGGSVAGDRRRAAQGCAAPKSRSPAALWPLAEAGD
ncbi:hypothetical protein Xmer_17240 [Xanthomonas campestris pv. merremiae]|nr:hypothetical protein [Xanthomonas campestris pv. merremiae]